MELLDSANEMVRDRASSFILGRISPETAPAAPTTATTPGICIQIITRDPPMVDVTPAPLEIFQP